MKTVTFSKPTLDSLKESIDKTNKKLVQISENIRNSILDVSCSHNKIEQSIIAGGFFRNPYTKALRDWEKLNGLKIRNDLTRS